jgi:hypothetical protein
MLTTMGQRKRRYQKLMTALMEEIKNGLNRDTAVQRSIEIYESCFDNVNLEPLKGFKNK